jgi:hypothetical protein
MWVNKTLLEKGLYIDIVNNLRIVEVRKIVCTGGTGLKDL